MATDVSATITGFSLSVMDEEARERLRACVLDTIGCMVAGSQLQSTKVLQSAGPWMGPGVGALFGGTTSHSVEMDDFHNGATIHPGVVVVPAALEVALTHGLDGRRFLESVTVGYETAIRIGLAGEGSYYARGFHPTSAAGVFGAAAAAGTGLGLSPDEMDNALGIAGSNAGGLLEYKSEGAWTKRLQVGMAAETGVRAAVLAAEGFTGPSTILDGRYGFLKAYPVEHSTAPLAPPWAFDSIRQVSHKPYACCRFIHSALDAFREAVTELGVQADEIAGIKIETHQQAIDSTGKPEARKYRPEGTVDAQFSLPFAIGVAAVNDGRVLPDHFVGDALRDEVTLDIASMVTFEATDEFTGRFPNSNGARVRVTADGQSTTETVWTPRGEPENALSNDDLVEKFERLAAGILSDPPAVAERILALDGDEVSFLSDVVPVAQM